MENQKWAIDAAHSEITFKVRHMMITNVTGKFTSFNAEVSAEDDSFSGASISFSAGTSSVDTGNEERDNHLKSEDFFNAEKFPKMSFKSDSYDASTGKVSGELTMRDVTRSITLDADFGGVNKDPWGNMKAGFTLSGKINRKDFGLNWNAALETGGVLVSDEVRINCEVQFSKA